MVVFGSVGYNCSPIGRVWELVGHLFDLEDESEFGQVYRGLLPHPYGYAIKICGGRPRAHPPGGSV